MKMILGGSMARVGALSECPFQGDESIHTAGNTCLCEWASWAPVLPSLILSILLTSLPLSNSSFGSPTPHLFLGLLDSVTPNPLHL